MHNAYFVAGTDTDVGKTVCSCAILHAAQQAGIAMVGYKPIASGSDNTSQGLRNSDALLLQQASSVSVTYDEVNPYAFYRPVSPHIAAAEEHKTIEFSVLSQGLADLKAKSECVLIEGAGGWRVPVNNSDYLSSWVKQEQLPVILVVGVKLGCLNHALLTAEAIQADGLTIVGWIANQVQSTTDNYTVMITWLEQHLPGKKIAEIPYCPTNKRDFLADYIDLTVLN
ncbi:ATP-dependent dethiobiotin synthetase BioD [Photobacterium phosphoreum]|jgi:dethiobiotin synthetase|uniref:ATP-dependent dethiobiotin synthetase BioD n=1 Tax=Photobacterium phosphoreum TaxID=659 RepID=A0AAW4ZQ76_PHOPO|nr:dethiobiotin synthase [Photobacterium phosphoreum]MCD9461548.1 ATP-dependent dethiobiotin synthetase BioD [Photobacterium phosphoreum]MCD9469657.1 ATP-dependent dethiobiotin synthetase BioD [Photobacterium phosphoreum]MCD9473659.1 ATP-dependent dethiobiotin synthetase BioD [Photobacterium phosphoreum]MCD9478590.1 ATP-dependent dethiobiotin synthetase BioD [Photobacterium phosphoreum]MCD9489702.1 ATP-dependent dethiobiotin synthetase BioD [Photobacterium phosphoreum]